MWKALFETVERITGQPLRLKAFDGTGLLAILGDGDSAQAGGLADWLFLKYRWTVADVMDLLSYIYQTCWIHAHR